MKYLLLMHYHRTTFMKYLLLMHNHRTTLVRSFPYLDQFDFTIRSNLTIIPYEHIHALLTHPLYVMAVEWHKELFLISRLATVNQSVNYLTIFQDFPAFLHIMQSKGWGSEEPGTRSYGTVNLMKVQTSSPLQHLNLLTIMGSFPAFNTHMLTVLTQSLSVYSNWLSSSHYQLPCGIILSSTRIRCSSHKAEIPTPTSS